MFGFIAVFLFAAVCFVVGFLTIGMGGRTPEVRHHHSIGYGLGCGWVFLVVGALAVAVGALGLADGRP